MGTLRGEDGCGGGLFGFGLWDGRFVEGGGRDAVFDWNGRGDVDEEGSVFE